MTPNRPQSPPPTTAASTPIHTSLRSTAAVNVDPVTGTRTQVLTTSRLAIHWVGREVRVEYGASRVQSDNERYIPVQRRTGRAL
jgi:hypothetical protein